MFSAPRQRETPEIAWNNEWTLQCTGWYVFRIEKEVGEQKTRVIISGEISSACIELAEACCRQAIRDGNAVDLVLDITSIDESGRALLQRLAATGVHLAAEGVYHSWLVDTIRGAASDDSKPVR
jgi:hypothetical protein